MRGAAPLRSRARLVPFAIAFLAAGLLALPATLSAATPATNVDFDGDGRSDIGVWRPSSSTWFVRGGATTQFGVAGDVPVPADYDGDGKTDIAVYRPSTGNWLIRGGATIQWGVFGDVPVPGDYNGDLKADIAVWRPSTGHWFVRGGATTQWGVETDVAVPSDFNGDGTTDIAVWRPSTGLWYVLGSSPVQWGVKDDLPVSGDFDGDGKSDIAVWRPSTGTWFVRGVAMTQLGVAGDVPVPADYNGDGKTDVAVWRPSTGVWYVLGNSPLQWGVPTDVPLDENAAASAPAGPPPDTAAPSTPANLTATSTTATTIAVSWSASTDNVGVTGYGTYRNGSSAGSTGAGTRTFTFAGLTCGTTYTLAVDAADAAGNRSGKATITAATSACAPDTTPPTVPTGQQISATTQNTITMVWNASTDNVGVAGYRAYLNGVLAGTTQELSYTYSGLSCGTTYTVALEAYDAAGNASNRTLAQGPATTSACSPSGDTQAPTAPSGLSVTGSTASSVSLSWNAATDNVGVTGYGRYVNGSLVSSGAGTTYTFSGLACGTSYTLGVDAYDAAGNRSTRTSTTAATAACPPPPPPGTANLYLSPFGSDANPCTQAAPCLSFNRAYQLAQPGNIVEVAGGSYGAQRINYQSAKGTAGSHVRFRPALGASVTVTGDFENRAAWFWVEGIKVNGNLELADGGPNAHHIVFDRIDSANFLIGPGHDIRLSNSDIGPSNGCGFSHENKIGPDGNIPNAVPYNLEILNNVIHDQNGDPSGGCHFGGLFLIHGHHWLFSGNKFIRNVVYDVYISPFAGSGYGGAPSDVTWENNWFAGPVEWRPLDTTWDGQPNMQFTCHGDPTPANCNLRNWLIRYNSFYRSSLHFFSSGTNTNFRIIGNIGGKPSSSSCGRATYAYNVWVNGTCSATDRAASALPYVSTSLASPDFHLTGGIAQDLVTPTTGDYALGIDIDGQARPRGPARDAGADER